MGDETKTGGAGPEEIFRGRPATDDTEGQGSRLPATDPEATEGDTEGQRLGGGTGRNLRGTAGPDAPHPNE